MCIFSAVFSAVISETTQIFRDHSLAFDTKLPEMSDVANQKILQQQKKKVNITGAQPDDHWIKSLMFIQLC